MVPFEYPVHFEEMGTLAQTYFYMFGNFFIGNLSFILFHNIWDVYAFACTHYLQRSKLLQDC